MAAFFSSLLVVLLLALAAGGQLVAEFYQDSCPELLSIVRNGVIRAIQTEERLAASLLRLHFHDCFVNGCDASILLDDTPDFAGEKSANPNRNSARGFEVIDDIKHEVETQCPGLVSCADILAIVARDSVELSGGPSWHVLLGRQDSLSASRAAANQFIPAPTLDLPSLVSAFQAVGLSERDLVALSGAHTIGAARCTTFSKRLYDSSGPDPSLSPDFLASLQQICPRNGNPNRLAPLDMASPQAFDNSYFRNLFAGEGLLHSDQVLSAEEVASEYASDQDSFYHDFAQSMIRMGNLGPTASDQSEIRNNCRFPNL